MTDLLNETLLALRERLDELEPLVVEHARLRAALEALDALDEADRSAPASARDSARRGGPRAARGANKHKVYEVISDRPGATVAEIAAASGVAKPLVYNVTRTGVQRRELRREELPSGRAGFSLVVDHDDATAAEEAPGE